MVEKIDPVAFKEFAKNAQLSAQRRMATYQHIAQLKLPKEAQLAAASVAAAPAKDEE
jgi:hypothetical protein